VIDKILFQHEIFAHRRFLMQMSIGAMPHDKVPKSVELRYDSRTGSAERNRTPSDAQDAATAR
jgi:hypothetical protein